MYVYILHLQLAWYEVQIQDGRPNKTRERKCRVLWTGEVTPPAIRHNQPTGQGLHHTAMYQLPQNEDGISRRWVAAYRQTDTFSETTGFYTKKDALKRMFAVSENLFSYTCRRLMLCKFLFVNTRILNRDM